MVVPENGDERNERALGAQDYWGTRINLVLPIFLSAEVSFLHGILCLRRLTEYIQRSNSFLPNVQWYC